MDKFRQYKNYAIITILALFILFFFPFAGSVLGMGFVFPNTAAGWIVFVVNKLIIGFVNIMILYCFCEQAKINVRNDERYIEAKKILFGQTNVKELLPKSPKQHSREVYGKKGITIFITSILGAISLSQAVLTFDVITMLTYLFTLIIGIICGIIQMGEDEIYWTEDVYKYAIMIRDKGAERKREEDMALVAEEPADTGNDTPDTTG